MVCLSMMCIDRMCQKGSNRFLIKGNVMKKIIWLSVLTATLCGCDDGFKMLNPGQGVTSSSTSTTTSNSTSNTTSDTSSKDWSYFKISNGENVVVASVARKNADTTYERTDLPNLKGWSFVNLIRTRLDSGAIQPEVRLYTASNTSCDASCVVNIKFDSVVRSYTMREVTEGVLIGFNDSISSNLYKRFSESKRAEVEMPLEKEGKVKVVFNLTGFDASQMAL